MKCVATVVLALCVGCGGAATPAASPGTASPASTSDIKAPGQAKVGDRTRCPVSGEEFVVTGDSPHVEQGGQTYYFCCPHCVHVFNADPQKYVGKPGA